MNKIFKYAKKGPKVFIRKSIGKIVQGIIRAKLIRRFKSSLQHIKISYYFSKGKRLKTHAVVEKFSQQRITS